MPPEKNRARATGNKHIIWWSSAVWFSSYVSGQTDRLTDRQTYLRTPTGGEINQIISFPLRSSASFCENLSLYDVIYKFHGHFGLLETGEQSALPSESYRNPLKFNTATFVALLYHIQWIDEWLTEQQILRLFQRRQKLYGRCSLWKRFISCSFILWPPEGRCHDNQFCGQICEIGWPHLDRPNHMG